MSQTGIVPTVPEPLTPDPPEPLDAAVILPCASTVILADVYEPAVTAVLSKSIVIVALPSTGCVVVVDIPVPPTQKTESYCRTL